MAFTGSYLTNTYIEKLHAAQIDISTHTFRVALYTNSATLDATTTAYTATGEVATGGGYTAGGTTVTLTYSVVLTNRGYVPIIDISDATWAASTITARGAMLYDDTAAGNPAMLIIDFGSDKSTSGTSFTVQFPSVANGNGPITFFGTINT